MSGFKARLGAALVAASLAAGGCANRADPDDGSLLALQAEALACPPARLLADTAHLVVTAAAEGTDGAATYEADLISATTTCRQEGERWAVSVRYRASAGPVGVAAAGTVRLPIFVALAEYRRRVMDKKLIALPVTFAAGVPRVSIDQTIEGISAPLAELHPGPGYEILVGFQLTPEQVAANRRRLRPE